MKKLFFILFITTIFASCQKTSCELSGAREKVKVKNHTDKGIQLSDDQGNPTITVAAFSEVEVTSYSSSYSATINNRVESYLVPNDCKVFVINLYN